MREIKFRAYVKEYNKCFPVLTIWDNSVCLDLSKTDDLFDRKVFSRDKIKLMQYTGLKDINGKELYEGDIIKCKYNEMYCNETEIGLVIWNNQLSAYSLDNGEIKPTLSCFNENKLEVIGNEYENPELLNCNIIGG